jgi:transcriptional regulator with XRE-family HTH domain
MRLERSKGWWLSKARREGDAAVGAGMLAFDPAPDERGGSGADETRIAFGRFVNLMRRRRGFSIERLAQEAALDVSELLIIEESTNNVPDPRTIYQLAQVFDLPQRSLMALAGLTVANDQGLREEAVRFAARSESVQKLTPEESSALEAFVAVLSQQESKRPK